MSAEHILTLSEGLHAPARARSWLSAHVPQLARGHVDDALLLVSELVTNAVRHGSPDIELRLRVGPDRLRLEVHDSSEVLPVVPPDRPAVDRPTGRGLLIVAATASDWGVTRTAGRPGKVVWVELSLDAPGASA